MSTAGTATCAVHAERRDGVLVITLNRPEARNAVNPALAAGVAAALDDLDADDGLHVGVLTGAGPGFAAGMDPNAPLAVRASKHVVRAALDWDEAEAWGCQRGLLEPVLESEDAREGARAFAEKRPPWWQGR